MVIRSRVRIPDCFSTSLTISEYGILEDLSAFLSHRPICITLSEMTDADKVMNPQHFGSDPADIRIRIRVNPEIRIRPPDHFWLKLDALAEVCVLRARSSLFCEVFIFIRVCYSEMMCLRRGYPRISVLLNIFVIPLTLQ